jgi:hypothetical protein
MGHGRRSDQTQVLVEAWVPACAGMARKSDSLIVTMFVQPLSPVWQDFDVSLVPLLLSKSSEWI